MIWIATMSYLSSTEFYRVSMDMFCLSHFLSRPEQIRSDSPCEIWMLRLTLHSKNMELTCIDIARENWQYSTNVRILLNLEWGPQKMKLNIELLKDVTSPVPRTSQIGCIDFVLGGTKVTPPTWVRTNEDDPRRQHGSGKWSFKVEKSCGSTPKITKRVQLPACQLKGRVKKRPGKYRVAFVLRQLGLVLRAKLMKINSNLFSSFFFPWSIFRFSWQKIRDFF